MSSIFCVNSSRYYKLKESVKSLMNFARHTKAQRTQGGAVELDSVELKVQMTKDKDIEKLITRQV